MSNNKANDLIHSFPGNSQSMPNFKGLTKREYFAGLAMQGELSGQSPDSTWMDAESLVKRSVLLADALIKELNKDL